MSDHEAGCYFMLGAIICTFIAGWMLGLRQHHPDDRHAFALGMGCLLMLIPTTLLTVFTIAMFTTQ